MRMQLETHGPGSAATSAGGMLRFLDATETSSECDSLLEPLERYFRHKQTYELRTDGIYVYTV